MDSFEWFGEIGNQLYDSLKPPGTSHREIFNTATMGLESFGGGGGGDEGQKRSDRKRQKAQDKYNKQLYEFQNEQAVRQRNWQLDINKQQRKDHEEAWQFKTNERADAYANNKALRDFAHSEKVRQAKHITEVLIPEQMRYNDLSRGKAHQNAAQVAAERRIKLALNARTSATEYAQKGEQLKLKAGQTRLAYRQGMKTHLLKEGASAAAHDVKTRDLQNKRVQATIKYQDATADIAFAGVQSQRERIKALGKARLLQAGQSAGATGRDIIAAFSQRDQRLLYKAKNMGLQHQAELYGIDNAMMGLAKSRFFEKAKLALDKHGMQEARALQIKGQETDQRYLNLFRDIRLEEERQTGQSITAAYDRMIDDIDMKWEGAQMAARAKIPLEVIKGPDPLPLRALPKVTILDPPKPVKGPKPIKAASYSGTGAGSVTGSTTGNILGGLSAGATALGAFGSMAASGGGAIGLGSMGAIGLGAMGPIGIGIGAIAGIGRVFRWW